MKKSLITTLLVLICGGCAYFYHPTYTAYDRKISHMVGRGTAELYAEWGYPQKTQSINCKNCSEMFKSS